MNNCFVCPKGKRPIPIINNKFNFRISADDFISIIDAVIPYTELIYESDKIKDICKKYCIISKTEIETACFFRDILKLEMSKDDNSKNRIKKITKVLNIIYLREKRTDELFTRFFLSKKQRSAIKKLRDNYVKKYKDYYNTIVEDAKLEYNFSLTMECCQISDYYYPDNPILSFEEVLKQQASAHKNEIEKPKRIQTLDEYERERNIKKEEKQKDITSTQEPTNKVQ